MKRTADEVPQVVASTSRALMITVLGAVVLVVAAGILLVRAHTAHISADYGDTFRLIDQWLIPVESGSSPDRVALLLREYETLSHSHILTRLALSASGWGSGYHFDLLGHIGAAALIMQLLVLGVVVGWWFSRDLGVHGWLFGIPVVLAMVRFDAVNSLTNDYTAFQYLYQTLGIAYLLLLANYLDRGTRRWWVVVVGVIAAVLGGAPGAVAVVAGLGMAVVAVWRRRVFRRMAVAVVPFVAAVTFGWLAQSLGARGQPGGTRPLDQWSPVELFGWVLDAGSQSVVDFAGLASWRGAGTVAIAVGAVVVIAGSIMVVSDRVPARASYAGTGLVVAGYLTFVGSYRVRPQDASVVFAPRYLPWFGVAVAGLVLLVLWRYRRKPAALIATTAVIALLFSVRAGLGLQGIDSHAAFYDMYDRRLLSYQPESLDELPDEEAEWLVNRLAFYQRGDLAIAERVLDWHALNVARDR